VASAQARGEVETRLKGARNAPSDVCPWPKPFPEAFEGCPAFQPVHFIPLDTRFRLLGPVLTCRHLITRDRPDQPHRYYAACNIGDEGERQRWVETVDSDWLQGMANIRRDMDTIIRPFIERIWRTKAEQLAALDAGEIHQAIDAALAAAAKQFLVESRACLDAHEDDLRRLALSADAVMSLLQRSLDAFIDQRTTLARWRISDDLLASFPDRIRVFFRPRLKRP